MTLKNKKKNMNNKSLYEPISFDKEGNEVTLIDLIGQDEESVIGIVENKFATQKLMEVIKTQLTEREYQIISMRYGLDNKEPMTQKQVAQRFEISRSYVSRIETRVLAKLKAYMIKEKMFF